MPSPFPGMDPFLEGQKWRDFHTSALYVTRRLLTARLKPRYSVDIEESVYEASLDYQQAVVPALTPADARWVRQVLDAWQGART